MTFPLLSPEDYFSGENWTAALPERVLLFTRNSRRTLGKQHIHHSRYNLLVALEGGCRIMLDREAVPVPSGGTLLIQPWQTFRFLYDDDKPLQWLFFGFDWAERNTDIPQGEVRVQSPIFRAVAEWALERQLASGAGSWLALLLAVLLAEFPRLPRQAPEAIPLLNGAHSLVLRVQHILVDNLRRPITVGEIAERCAYSESRLRHVFQQQTGISLGNYIRIARYNEAARLICRTPKTISQVAELCGFSSVYAFSRGFKSVFDLSPLRYRRRFGSHPISVSPER